MRSFKGYVLLVMGSALILQACGSNINTQTLAPVSNTESVNVTQPPATEVPATENPSGEFFSSVPVRSGFGYRAPWIEVYFTDPVNPLAARQVGGIDAFISAAIVAAKESVDIALRNLNLDSMANALIVANRRGIVIRVVAETDSMTDKSDFQLLKDAGIAVVEDQQPGLMNNRFVVIDHKEVWTGSLSYDLDGVFREYNTLIRINSPEVAADYTKEFNEMFENSQFGPLVVPETPNPSVDIQGTQVEVLFSPDDIVSARLSQLIAESQQSISFLAYSFASSELGTAIRAKAADGVTVGGVVEFDLIDPNQPSPNPNLVEEFNYFQQAGIKILPERHPEVLNHKIMIIDGKIVVVGSYDFTNRAEIENDENVLIIHNEMIARKFMEEFQRVATRAQE